MKATTTILGVMLLTSTVLASNLINLNRSPLTRGQVYKYYDIVIYNESKISRNQVLHDLVINFTPKFSANLEAGGELNTTEEFEEQVLALPSSSETIYTLKVKNEANGMLEISLIKNNEILLNDSSEISIGGFKEHKLSDGTTYLRTCGMNIGQ